MRIILFDLPKISSILTNIYLLRNSYILFLLTLDGVQAKYQFRSPDRISAVVQPYNEQSV